MNNPAPTSNNNDSETCATINPLLKRETAPVARRLCLSEVAKSSFVARHAGASPNSTPVSNETNSVNASTRQFTLRVTLLGINPVSLSVSATSALLPHMAKSTPTTPPRPASSTLSVNNCRINRPRPAPTASRTVISALREVARASNRLATLAQAISSTSATTTNSAKIVGAYNRRTSSIPELPDSTSKCGYSFGSICAVSSARRGGGINSNAAD